MLPRLASGLAVKFVQIFVSVTLLYYAKRSRDHIFGINENEKKSKPKKEYYPEVKFSSKSKHILAQKSDEEELYPVENGYKSF